LRALESTGLKVVVAQTDTGRSAQSLRAFELELVGDDRVGIVSQLTRMLAERGVSIESIHTEVLRSGVSGKQTFKVGAHLLVPAALSIDELRRDLGTLAHEMMLDLALGERGTTA
jgi:methionyl-tRNA formyltransferase